MDLKAFEAELRREGYDDVATVALPPGGRNEPHAHAFDVRAVVIEGRITVHCDGADTSCGPGDVFTMAAARPHAETIGPEGVRYMVGRRRIAA